MVNTLSKSAAIAICLYSCGLWARYAELLKYDTVNTLAPPSLAAGMIFGVWISTKPYDISNGATLTLSSMEIQCSKTHQEGKKY
jgi:hypothetical protein